jgi:Zn-finger nucleic acid-binding protein
MPITQLQEDPLMKCPVCTTADLLMTERLGIEIDYCPQCRGVWLDRGELDKILARSAQDSSATYATNDSRDPRFDPNRFGSGHHDRDRDRHDNHYGHAKKPFWQELFD